MLGQVLGPGQAEVFAPSPGDLLGLITSRSRHHLGLPPGAKVGVGTVVPLQITLTVGDHPLRAGDVWLFTVSQLLAEALPIPNVPSGVLEEGLRVLGAAASAEATRVVGLAPLSWQAPKITGVPVPTAAHLHFTFSGTFGTSSSEEIWAIGLNCAMPAGDSTPPQMATMANLASQALRGTLGALQPPSVVHRDTVVARIGVDGHWERYPDGSYKVGRMAAQAPGQGSAGVVYPLQTALVVSLTTARPGSSGRGRFYLPFQGPALTPTFLLSAATTTAYLDASKAFLNAVSQAAGTPLVVVSKGALVAGSRTPPFATPVTGLRIGHVVDTMRSRRNSQVEAYSTATLA